MGVGTSWLSPVQPENLSEGMGVTIPPTPARSGLKGGDYYCIGAYPEEEEPTSSGLFKTGPSREDLQRTFLMRGKLLWKPVITIALVAFEEENFLRLFNI